MNRWFFTSMLVLIAYWAVIGVIGTIGLIGYRLSIWLIFGPLLAALTIHVLSAIVKGSRKEWHRNGT